MVSRIGLVTGRAPSRRPERHPWTQERSARPSAEAAFRGETELVVRYHVVIRATVEGEVQHLAVQYRAPAETRFHSGRTAVCGSPYDGLASRASFTGGRWCPEYPDSLRREIAR